MRLGFYFSIESDFLLNLIPNVFLPKYIPFSYRFRAIEHFFARFAEQGAHWSRPSLLARLLPARSQEMLPMSPGERK